MVDLAKTEIAELIGKENPIILDIGCYDGRDSREIANQFKECTVHCFDADPRSQLLFEDINHNDKRMHLWKMAISDINGNIDFHLSDSKTRRHYEFQTSWSASSSIRKPKFHKELFPEVTFEEMIRVRSMTLDFWYKTYLFDSVIDFIWADVNGAEGDLVLGGLNTLKEFTRYLYIETSDKECYEGEVKRERILKLLPEFEVLGVYKDEGNFGNVLLKNKNL